MNRTYKTVFNRSLGLWQAVAEIARSACKAGGNKRALVLLSAALITPASIGWAADNLLVGAGGIGGDGGAPWAGSGGSGGIGGGGGGGAGLAGSRAGGNGGSISGGGGGAGSSFPIGGSSSTDGGGGGGGYSEVAGNIYGDSGGGAIGASGGLAVWNSGKGGDNGGSGGGNHANGINGNYGTTQIESGAYALVASSSYAYVGIGGGGGGGGGSGTAGIGNDGTLDIHSTGLSMTVNNFMLVGGAGGGGSGSTVSSASAGGDGGSGNVSLDHGAGLIVNDRLLIGGSGGGGSGSRGGNGGDGVVSLSNGASLVVANTLFLGGERGANSASAGGAGGNGTLLINSGSSATNLIAHVGYGVGTTGTVTVDGSGSVWTNTGSLLVGDNGTGNLTIQAGGKVTAVFATLGNSATGVGTLNLNGTSDARGILETGYVNKGSGNATLNWNGGILRATGAQSNLMQGFTAGDIALQSGGAFIDTQNYNVGITTNGLLVGTGDLTKQGSGKLSIAGSNTYTGNTTVSAGTLQFDSFTQTASQTLGIGASSNSVYGKLAVTGTANFNVGASLAVDVASVNTLTLGQKLTGVITAGTLNASTFSVTDNSALFNFRSSINGNAVDLTVVPGITVLEAIDEHRLKSARGAAVILDGQVNGVSTGDMVNVVGALGQLGTTRDVARAAAQTLPVNSGTQSIQSILSSFGRVLSGRVGSSGLSAGDEALNKQVWLKPFGSRADQDSKSGAAGFAADSWGLAAGADAELSPGSRVGLAYGYAKTSITGNTDLSGTGQNAGIESHVLALYGNRPVATDLDLVYQADLGLNNNKGTRYLNFGGLNRTATSDYQTYTAHVGLGLNKTLALSDATTLTPGIRADYTWLRTEAYSESGAGALNLNVGKDTTDAFVLGADARAIHKLNERSSINAIVGVGYDTINKQGNIVSTFAGTPGQSFATPGIDHSPWLMRGGIGYSHKTPSGTDIAIRYDAEGRSGFINQTASVKATWAF